MGALPLSAPQTSRAPLRALGAALCLAAVAHGAAPQRRRLQDTRANYTDYSTLLRNDLLDGYHDTT